MFFIEHVGFRLRGRATLKSALPTISGKIIGLDGPINGANVSLTSFSDQACVKLAQSTGGLSDEDKQKLKECSVEVAKTTSDSKGYYEFSNIGSGWYSISISWVLDKKPDTQLNDASGNFTVVTLSLNGKIAVDALGDEIFEFSGKEPVIKNLTLH